jgi:Tol biopolymer transport system component
VLFRVAWFDRNGNDLGSAGTAGHYHRLRLSPDERFLAMVLMGHQTGDSDVWLTDFSRDLTSRFTFSGATDPVWSSDGGRIAYSMRQHSPSCRGTRAAAEPRRSCTSRPPP